jgi:hypothetical protein
MNNIFHDDRKEEQTKKLDFFFSTLFNKCRLFAFSKYYRVDKSRENKLQLL